MDLKEGVESASPPKRTAKVLLDWFISNLACACTLLFFKGIRIHFRRWIVQPESLLKHCKYLEHDFYERELNADHMLAGNKIRLLPNQKLRSTVDTNYQRLTRSQNFIGKTVEILTPFWSK